MNLIFVNWALGAVVGILFVLVWNVAKCLKTLTEIRDRLPPTTTSATQASSDAG